MHQSGQFGSKAISGERMGVKNFRRRTLAESNLYLLVAVLVALAMLPLATIATAQSGKESKSAPRQALTDPVPQTPTKKPLLVELRVDADLGSVSAHAVWRPDTATQKNDVVEAVTELSGF